MVSEAQCQAPLTTCSSSDTSAPGLGARGCAFAPGPVSYAHGVILYEGAPCCVGRCTEQARGPWCPVALPPLSKKGSLCQSPSWQGRGLRKP